MAGDKIAYVDTVVLEHYLPLAEIEWRQVMEADDVELVIPSVTTRRDPEACPKCLKRSGSTYSDRCDRAPA
jgi:hypothetical protein